MLAPDRLSKHLTMILYGKRRSTLPKGNWFRSRKIENENGNSQGSCETLADDRTSAGSDSGPNWECRVC
jgi:hypothetical protein